MEWTCPVRRGVTTCGEAIGKGSGRRGSCAGAGLAVVGVAGAEGQSAFALRATFVSMRVWTAVGHATRDPGRPGARPRCCVGRRRRS
ncbi:DUF6207 family protein [Streptomyces mirabilis]